MIESFTARRCRPLFVLALLLSLGVSVQWSLRAVWWETIYPEVPALELGEACLEAVPRQLRNIVADACWLRADEYMHFGPTRRLAARFTPGSYAGNTEIMPLLELAISLDPNHVDAYSLIVQNLALHLGRFTDGLRLLQSGILSNRDNPRIHELYGTGAHLWGFRESYNVPEPNNHQAALQYAEKALALYRNPDNDPLADPIMVPRTYAIWKARFLVVLGRRTEAVQSWKAANLPLSLEGGLLGEYLRMVDAGQPVPELPEQLFSTPEPAAGNASQPSPAPAGTPHAQDPLDPFAQTQASANGHEKEHGECNHAEGECSHTAEAPAISTLEKFPRRLLWHLAILLLGTILLSRLARRPGIGS